MSTLFRTEHSQSTSSPLDIDQLLLRADSPDGVIGLAQAFNVVVKRQLGSPSWDHDRFGGPMKMSQEGRHARNIIFVGGQRPAESEWESFFFFVVFFLDRRGCRASSPQRGASLREAPSPVAARPVPVAKLSTYLTASQFTKRGQTLVRATDTKCA